jgi:hypothetical protein
MAFCRFLSMVSSQGKAGFARTVRHATVQAGMKGGGIKAHPAMQEAYVIGPASAFGMLDKAKRARAVKASGLLLAKLPTAGQ